VSYIKSIAHMVLGSYGEMSSSLKIATRRLYINLDFFIKPAVLNTAIRNGKFHFNNFLYGRHYRELSVGLCDLS
jgi:hypothetical protein